ncbi:MULTISPECIES: response regulator transcription factor [unclassified Streptomyces]|uniref:response regulator transcription factor n=1 Tax=unclassified Streptomyces TaxID=2593676 RepID=UPI000FDC46F4|nr:MULTISPECIES: response regulator transcription factor [unclassified Streptomyces]UQA35464.1 response regulator transcription factor [Streptomyces sp. HNA39]
MASVLLVEDDHFVRAALIRHLTDASHSVRSVGTALEALREISQLHFDVVILDLGLPDLDGTKALKMLRGIADVPVIIATARDDEAGIVRLLNDGADDYLTKPFSAEHLTARIAAVLRRSGSRSGADANTAMGMGTGPGVGMGMGGAMSTMGANGPARAPISHVIRVGGISVDPQRRSATLDGVELDLTRREFDLLAYLAGRPGTVVSRKDLLARVWNQPYGADKTVDVHLSWLRRKLGESAASPRYLHTYRGVGVKLEPPR